ncbi:acyl-CoA reductase [Bacillus tianshenii]|nr:acyl-CoA reductase [Bacillus tianshenii]
MIFLLPRQTSDWKDEVRSVSSQKMLKPFSEEVLQFLQSVSSRLLKERSLRQYPELVAVGYWLRKANIYQLKAEFEQAEKLLLPRGTVLHFAPSNVDSIFLYSWVLSMLAGNKNILRLSQRQNEQLNLLLNVIAEELTKEQFSKIAERTLIVSYEHDDAITSYLSSYCDVRVIWGGDTTIQKIRSLPLPPMATELVFADRFSSVLLAAEEINQLDSRALGQFVHQFYNDAFWFDQMACSSPRLVLWLGKENEIHAVKKKFWTELEGYLKQKKHSIAPALNINRFATSCFYGAQEHTKSVTNVGSEGFQRIELENLTDMDREMHCGAGLFLEISVQTLSEAASLFSHKDQTLSYFGFEKTQLHELVENLPNRGIDRIVSVGQALDFNSVWDGYDFLTYFTREVVVR